MIAVIPTPTTTLLASRPPIGTEVDVVWVKNFDEFENFILQHGLPDAICFDHDLAEDSYDERTGYDCAKLVVNYCMEHNQDIPPYAIQSSNPVGKEDIRHLLETITDFINMKNNKINMKEYNFSAYRKENLHTLRTAYFGIKKELKLLKEEHL